MDDVKLWVKHTVGQHGDLVFQTGCWAHSPAIAMTLILKQKLNHGEARWITANICFPQWPWPPALFLKEFAQQAHLSQ